MSGNVARKTRPFCRRPSHKCPAPGTAHASAQTSATVPFSAASPSLAGRATRAFIASDRIALSAVRSRVFATVAVYRSLPPIADETTHATAAPSGTAATARTLFEPTTIPPSSSATRRERRQRRRRQHQPHAVAAGRFTGGHEIRSWSCSPRGRLICCEADGVPIGASTPQRGGPADPRTEDRAGVQPEAAGADRQLHIVPMKRPLGALMANDAAEEIDQSRRRGRQSWRAGDPPRRAAPPGARQSRARAAAKSAATPLRARDSRIRAAPSQLLEMRQPLELAEPLLDLGLREPQQTLQTEVLDRKRRHRAAGNDRAGERRHPTSRRRPAR